MWLPVCVGKDWKGCRLWWLSGLARALTPPPRQSPQGDFTAPRSFDHYITHCLWPVAPRCQRKLDWDRLRYELWSCAGDCAAPGDSRLRATALPDLHSPPQPCYKDHAVREAPGVRYSRAPGRPPATCFPLPRQRERSGSCLGCNWRLWLDLAWVYCTDT